MEKFEVWMRNDSELREVTIISYRSALKNIEEDMKLRGMLKFNLIGLEPLELDEIYNQYFLIPEVADGNLRGHKRKSSAFQWFIKYKKSALNG